MGSIGLILMPYPFTSPENCPVGISRAMCSIGSILILPPFTSPENCKAFRSKNTIHTLFKIKIFIVLAQIYKLTSGLLNKISGNYILITMFYYNHIFLCVLGRWKFIIFNFIISIQLYQLLYQLYQIIFNNTNKRSISIQLNWLSECNLILDYIINVEIIATGKLICTKM